MGKKSCDFFCSKEVRVQVGSAKAIGLVLCRGSDKRVVVPKAICIGLKGVPVWEHVLKLVALQVVKRGLYSIFCIVTMNVLTRLVEFELWREICTFLCTGDWENGRWTKYSQVKRNCESHLSRAFLLSSLLSFLFFIIFLILKRFFFSFFSFFFFWIWKRFFLPLLNW